MSTTKVLHTSDLHGRYKPLLSCSYDFDVWIDTGDFFPNRGHLPGIDPPAEARHQSEWWQHKQLGPQLAEWLDGRPAVCVAGNHDFINLQTLLSRSGAKTKRIRPEGTKLYGLVWAGFRQVPYIEGEWNDELESDGMAAVVAATWASRPNILCTHTPPGSILDHRSFGDPNLSIALMYRPHQIRHHFFGHVHENGGRTVQHGPTLFHNGAEHIVVHEVATDSRTW